MESQKIGTLDKMREKNEHFSSQRVIMNGNRKINF